MKLTRLYYWLPVILILGSSQVSAQRITFSKDISPIIFQKCTPCHRKGQIGPMPLTNYEEVTSYASMIAYVTKVGYMPPWRGEAGPHPIKGASFLSPTELQLIQDWVQNGMEEGIREQTPVLPVFSETIKMTNPDLVVGMEEAFEQYGVYYDQYRVFVLPTHLKEDKMVSAIEFVPGEKTIVRGAMISIDTSDAVNSLDAWDPQYGYFSFGELGFIPYESRWYNWHPGKEITIYPRGEGKLLPKGAKLLLHIHYGPTGVPLKDSSVVNIKFAKTKKVNPIITAPLIHQYNMTNDTFFIPANDTIRYHAKFVVPFDMELRGLFPHSHLLGRAWDIFAVSSERESSFRLLKINDWDFNWKQMYEFEKPVSLKKGTIIHALATFDNTGNNPSNPSDPSRPMTWGKRMFEEMFIVYFSFKQVVTQAYNNIHVEWLPGTVNLNADNAVFYFEHTKTTHFSCFIKDF